MRAPVSCTVNLRSGARESRGAVRPRSRQQDPSSLHIMQVFRRDERGFGRLISRHRSATQVRSVGERVVAGGSWQREESLEFAVDIGVVEEREVMEALEGGADVEGDVADGVGRLSGGAWNSDE